MHLDIITPDKNVFEGEVSLVQVPGSKGSFEVLDNHAPIISSLEKGKIRIKPKGEDEQYFDVDGGVIEVKNNKVIILAEVCESDISL